MTHEPKDILVRLADSTPNESSHDLYCRCLDAAEEVSRLRTTLKTVRVEMDAQDTLFELWGMVDAVLPLWGVDAGIVEVDGFTPIRDLVQLPNGTVMHKDDVSTT